MRISDRSSTCPLPIFSSSACPSPRTSLMDRLPHSSIDGEHGNGSEGHGDRQAANGGGIVRKGMGMTRKRTAGRLGTAVAVAAGAVIGYGGAFGASLPGGASSLNETYQDWIVACQARDDAARCVMTHIRSEEHTTELQSLMRITYAV